MKINTITVAIWHDDEEKVIALSWPGKAEGRNSSPQNSGAFMADIKFSGRMFAGDYSEAGSAEIRDIDSFENFIRCNLANFWLLRSVKIMKITEVKPAHETFETPNRAEKWEWMKFSDMNNARQIAAGNRRKLEAK